MPAKPVSEEPHINLERWGIFVSLLATVHLVGSPAGTTRGRRSSPVVAFDLSTMTATTESGRTYRLVGKEDWRNAVVIMVAMHGLIDVSPVRWVTAEDLALHVASPSPRGMN